MPDATSAPEHHHLSASERATPTTSRWTCPICGESRTKLLAEGKNEAHLRNDLLAHVRTIDGGGHGPAGTYPDGFDRDGLGDLVQRSDA